MDIESAIALFNTGDTSIDEAAQLCEMSREEFTDRMCDLEDRSSTTSLQIQPAK